MYFTTIPSISESTQPSDTYHEVCKPYAKSMAFQGW
jgi:hypothetical protein